MTTRMEMNELERAVIGAMLGHPELNPVRRRIDFGSVPVRSRDHTGVGFFTEFESCDELRVFDAGTSLRWGKVGARLNAAKIDTGYLVYIDGGCVTAVEGYTYGDDWPMTIEVFELYSI